MLKILPSHVTAIFFQISVIGARNKKDYDTFFYDSEKEQTKKLRLSRFIKFETGDKSVTMYVESVRTDFCL